jgi:hypothetical protein
MVVIVLGRCDQTSWPDLCIFTDLDDTMTEEATEAVDSSPVTNCNPTLGSGSEIDGILEQAFSTDVNIGRIDNFSPYSDNRSLTHTAFDVSVFRSRDADAE